MKPSSMTAHFANLPCPGTSRIPMTFLQLNTHALIAIGCPVYLHSNILFISGNVYNSRGSINNINRIFQRNRSRESRVTASLLLVAAAFAIFWLPRGLVNLSAVIVGRESVPKAVEYLTSVFIFMSSFVNPLIYALFHYEYNKAFRQILRCKKKCIVGNK